MQYVQLQFHEAVLFLLDWCWGPRQQSTPPVVGFLRTPDFVCWFAVSRVVFFCCEFPCLGLIPAALVSPSPVFVLFLVRFSVPLILGLRPGG